MPVDGTQAPCGIENHEPLEAARLNLEMNSSGTSRRGSSNKAAEVAEAPRARARADIEAHFLRLDAE